MPKAASASPRNATLRGKRDFDRVYRKGIRARRPAVTVVAAHRESHPPGDSDKGSSRVAFVAGRGVGKATVRNRAKRRLRGALQQLDLPAGWDIVFIAGPVTATCEFAALVEQLDSAVQAATGSSGPAGRT